MPEIQVPELARKLARRFGITGGNVAPSLAPEIVPVTLVEDLSVPTPEDTGYEKTCVAEAAAGATAAQYSYSQLMNPAVSGVLVHVEAAIAGLTAANNLRIRTYDTAVGSAVTEAFRDRRLQGRPATQVTYHTSAASLGATIIQFTAAQNDPVLIPIDMVLSPGQGLVCTCDTVQVGVFCTWYWTERPLLPGE